MPVKPPPCMACEFKFLFDMRVCKHIYEPTYLVHKYFYV